MRLEQTQRTEQKLVLTQVMKQSLEVLQLPLQGLREYIDEAALANPLIELDEQPREEPMPDLAAPRQTMEDSENWDMPTAQQPVYLTGQSELGSWYSSDPEAEGSIFDTVIQQGESFTGQLHEQLAVMKALPSALRELCDYLVDCLNEKGYLDLDLSEIAAECRVTLFDAEQALYVLQSLEPAGVGARTLGECLVLQLSRGNQFNAVTLHMATEGLPLLAKEDFSGLMRLLKCSREEARTAAQAVRALNPIPSRGYGLSGHTAYQVPEAQLECVNGTLTVEMNRSFLPRIRTNKQTEQLLRQSGTESDLRYLKEHEEQTRQLSQCVEKRISTLERLLRAIVERQKGYFCSNGPLVPMTMGELAVELNLNISTVSRALNGKTVTFNGQNLPLKNLFTTAVTSAQGVAVSSSIVKRYIAAFVKAEDAAKPLPDEELRLALAAVNLPVSRRTVAKYREELGILSSSARRRKNNGN